MKEELIKLILEGVQCSFDEEQLRDIRAAVKSALTGFEVEKKLTDTEQRSRDNMALMHSFLSAKKVEGCSDKTLNYYEATIKKLLLAVDKQLTYFTTDDIRPYLSDFKETRNSSKVTIDNIRRIFSSFFSWLEEEDYIAKNPVRRIHKVRTDTVVKEIISDESMEILRDSCTDIRDLAMIDLLASTGIRVGELVGINKSDINFQERECLVFGKGNKEHTVYFNARTKIHL